MRIRTAPKRRIEYYENRVRGILNYDTSNDYPQKVERIIDDSGRATLCCDIYSRFLEGIGFNADLINELVVNKRLVTAWDLLQSVVYDYSRFHGLSIHVNYNALGQIVSLTHIPFKYCRLGIPDDREYVGKIAIYNNWDRSKRRQLKVNEIIWINIFNPRKDIILSQVEKAGGWNNYNGQIYWHSKLGDSTYPLSSADAVLEDCVTDGQIKTFKYNNVTTNFLASHLFITKGKIEGDNESSNLETDLMEFQGAENANKIMHVELERDEEVPDLKPFETVNNDKLFEYTEQSIHENIRKQYLIPPVLTGDLIAGKLGTSEEIYDAYALYNALTMKERNMLGRIFKRLFSIWHESLGDDFSIKPNVIDFGERTKRAVKEAEKIQTEKETKTQEQTTE
jgi:hypothetical protein